MTITQLQYVLAVSDYLSFVKAAEACFVTQPTLSMQIQKLEDELNVKLFDRSKQPIKPTQAGEIVSKNARIILQQTKTLTDELAIEKGVVAGTLKIGIIPTVAGYLLPLFIQNFTTKYPLIKLVVNELTTEEIIERLKKETIDAAILATPLTEKMLHETPMYYEPFIAYVNKKSPMAKFKQLQMSDLDKDKLWILKEGHCWRNQVFNLCNINHNFDEGFEYETGNLETLKKMVDINGGFTILPALSVAEFGMAETNKLRYFQEPEPVREISIVTHRDYYKKNLINALKEVILNAIPEKMKMKKTTPIKI